MRSQRLMYAEPSPPATPAGSSPVAPVCEEFCELVPGCSNSHGSAATSAATSPSRSSSTALATFTERAPANLSANSTRSSANCCVDAQAQKDKLQTLYDSLAQDYFAV